MNALEEENFFRSIATVINTPSGDWKIPVVAGKGEASWMDEEGAFPESDDAFGQVDLFSLELFENIVFVMAKHADGSVPDTPEEWLDRFGMLSIYQVLPQLIELWGLNVQTDVEAKKTAPD